MSEDRARKPYNRYTRVESLIDKRFDIVFLSGCKEDLLDLIEYLDGVKECIWLNEYNDHRLPSFNMNMLMLCIRDSGLERGVLRHKIDTGKTEWVFDNGIIIVACPMFLIQCGNYDLFRIKRIE